MSRMCAQASGHVLVRPVINGSDALGFFILDTGVCRASSFNSAYNNQYVKEMLLSKSVGLCYCSIDLLCCV